MCSWEFNPSSIILLIKQDRATVKAARLRIKELSFLPHGAPTYQVTVIWPRQFLYPSDVSFLMLTLGLLPMDKRRSHLQHITQCMFSVTFQYLCPLVLWFFHRAPYILMLSCTLFLCWQWFQGTTDFHYVVSNLVTLVLYVLVICSTDVSSSLFKTAQGIEESSRSSSKFLSNGWSLWLPATLHVTKFKLKLSSSGHAYQFLPVTSYYWIFTAYKVYRFVVCFFGFLVFWFVLSLPTDTQLWAPRKQRNYPNLLLWHIYSIQFTVCISDSVVAQEFTDFFFHFLYRAHHSRV